MVATANPVSSADFSALMEGLNLALPAGSNIAIAVSGGGDSMALTVLLQEWCVANQHKLYAITVDHGLRPEAKGEAAQVKKWLTPLGVHHQTLVWEGVKPKSRIQEMARAARYGLMVEFCKKREIAYLFVAHNANDQAETVLFRLAKGSGLDGLAGMSSISSYDKNLTLVRPLLNVRHEALLATLVGRKMSWIEDPSNQNIRYARSRIRNSFDVLEKEGLGIDRLNSLANRFARMSEAIDQTVEKEYKNTCVILDTERIEIKFFEFIKLPEEICIRILKKVIAQINPTALLKVRLEEIERLAVRVHKFDTFKGATLGGCIFRKKKNTLLVEREV